MADGGFVRDDRQSVVRSIKAAPETVRQDADDREDRRWKAENDLKVHNPLASSALGVTAGQVRFLRQFSVTTGLLGLLAPGLFWLIFGWVAFTLFACLMGFRILLVSAGLWARMKAGLALKSRTRKPAIWPVCSILVAIYREPDAVPGLVAALKGLDYPKRQLEIQFLIEESDTETLEALCLEKLKPHFRITVVPKGGIQTKPRALNYGLSFARGQYVAVYDAEDQMHAGQIKAAVRALQGETGHRIACVQAPLIPHNGGESWIARQFEIEYLTHFGLIVPGLAALGLPVMLGGTSNFFRRDILEAVGGWDPYNVTEDADLGLRLALAGYEVGVIAPPTFEEAPVRRRQWVGQRSRWVKGFIQTLGVFTRDPARKFSGLGGVKWTSAMLLLGGSVVSAIAHGPLAIWLMICVIWPGITPPVEGVLLLLTGFGVHLASGLLSASKFSVAQVWGLVTAPLYWPLQSLAAIKAIRELFSNPYFWDKTEHCVTKSQLCRSRLRR